MKTDNGNIDEVIRQQFKNFAPDAPDVWNAVAKGIHQPVPQPSVSVATKAAATSVKMWAAVAGMLTATAVTIWVIYTTNTPNTQPDSKNPSQMQVNEIPQQPNENQPEVVPAPQANAEGQEAQQTIQQTPLTSTDKLQNTSMQTEQQPAPQSKQPAAATVVPVRAEENRTDPIVSEPTKKQSVNQQEHMAQKLETKVLQPQTQTGPSSVQTPEPFIPNVITPNADGLNDAFIVEIPDAVSYRIKIVSMDNQVVFESNAITDYWNGTDIRNGENCREGIYAYVIHYQINNGEGKTLRGKVKLIRD